MERLTESSNNPIHFVLVPFMSPGHMNPMVDLGKLLAERGMNATIITTPQNALRFKSTADHALQTGLPLKFHELDVFPLIEDGGQQKKCDNLDSLVSAEAMMKFFKIADLLEEPLMEYLKNEKCRLPLCIISDWIFLWASKLATELNIPRFVFYCMPCFTLACTEILTTTWEGDQIVVPEIPHRIELVREQANVFFYGDAELQKLWKKGDSVSDGIIVNTCMGIEPTYVDIYRRRKGKNIWTVGPVGMCNRDMADKATRGLKSSSISATEISTFLDSMDPKSVIYVCFGTLSCTSSEQVIEICLGLMDSAHPFILVIQPKTNSVEIESWMESNRFEERNKDTGLVIRGWAPQVMILSHPSVGGFVTHCGWNSTLEGISAGLPMVTWPSFSDQFLNERFIVDVLEIGVMVGVKDPVWWWEEVVSVKREKFLKAVKELMGDGEEAVMRRRKALKLKKMADESMDIDGSSTNQLNALIQHVVELYEEKKTV
ncbi:Flavonoid glucosyltransferase, family GT1 [Zostera marina]|uniref:Glycosyltransferase n=1 Tax=Zostera marina TaxID=29655 RepID=A0A0K9PUV9_ZOSMR|nr:Flavonoid glucosyltransferase, family GT1 [Zostera marina]